MELSGRFSAPRGELVSLTFGSARPHPVGSFEGKDETVQATGLKHRLASPIFPGSRIPLGQPRDLARAFPQLNRWVEFQKLAPRIRLFIRGGAALKGRKYDARSST